MLFPSEADRKAIVKILGGIREGDDLTAAAERLFRIDPQFGPAWRLAGDGHSDRGESEQAIECYWKAVRLAPCTASYYISLGREAGKRPGGNGLSWHLVRLGLHCCAAGTSVPADLAETMRRLMPQRDDFDFKEPETYAVFAALWEKNRPEDAPAETPEELRPFEWLTQFRRDADGVVDEGLLSTIREHAAEAAPVFHAALREWARHSDALDDWSRDLSVAVLGEIGLPEAVRDLLDLSSVADDSLFLHANWAIWRLGQRFPAETLAIIEAAIPEASPPQRCAMAEHLGALPASIDIEAAILKLMEGLAKSARNQESAYLIMAATHALASRGHEEDARRLVLEKGALLRGKAQRVLDDMIDAADFVPRLEREELTELSIEDVCIDRVLLPDEEEDEDEDEEDEPAAPPYKPERNDPCWCGSGKKYKKCHLQQDETGSRPEVPLHQKLLLELAEAVSKRHSAAEKERAAVLYFGTSGRRPQATTEEGMAFLQWMVRDLRSAAGETPVEEHLRRMGSQLTAAERELLEAWRDGRYSLYEVQRVDRGVGVEMRDWFTDERFFVNDVSSSKQLVQWDCMLSRIERYRDRWEFSGDGILAPRTTIGRLLALADEERRATGETQAEWVKANSHRLHRVVSELAEQRPQLANTDGDPLEFSTAVYEVVDEAAAADALRGIPGFEAEEEGGGFRWTGPAGLGPDTALGRVAISGGKLRLECNSRKRLARGKKLIEDAAGKSIRYRKDEYETASAAMARLGPPSQDRPEDKLPPEVQADIMRKFKDQHYGKWSDTALPALDGRTPREAVRTEEGRAAVLRLIHDFENGEARARAEGRPAYDFSKMREELGLGQE